MNIEREILRGALWSLWASGLPRLMRRRYEGQGGILSFHRLQDPDTRAFSSQALNVTPENFRRVVRTLGGQGYRFLSMSELADWLQNPEPKCGKFVCLTFDDGYVDTYSQAFPICREFGVPMTVYLVSAFIRRKFPLWSLGVEATIAANTVVEFTWEGRQLRFATRTGRQKLKAYSAIASRLAMTSPARVRRVCTELERRYGIDFAGLLDRNILTPSMIAEMRASGVVEFGAHSVHHACLARLTENAARQEIAQSKQECEKLLGIPVQHFAYPYGDRQSAGPREAALCRELGFRTAVTTESNTIFAADRERPFLLPRLTFNGQVQNTPLLYLLLSGALPRLRRGLRDRGANAAARRPGVTSTGAADAGDRTTSGFLDVSHMTDGGATKW